MTRIEGVPDETFNPVIRAAYRATRHQLGRMVEPARDELFAALGKHFDEPQLLELINVIAVENMRGRFNAAFDMTPAGFSDGMACARPEPPATGERGHNKPATAGADEQQLVGS